MSRTECCQFWKSGLVSCVENITEAKIKKASSEKKKEQNNIFVGTLSLYTLSQSSPGISKCGGASQRDAKALRDMNIFFFLHHAWRDKHLLFGSDTAALAALKLLFHCPWVLFIDPVLCPFSPASPVWCSVLGSCLLFLRGRGIFRSARWSFFFFYISPAAYVGFCLSQLLPSSNANKWRQGKKKKRGRKSGTGGDGRE